ncbi:MAG: hypothetical protein E7013_04365 [Alphaproteobacteria bacterium]|nr:hypothetical protein [Alphaproteobacteria bacterium]
MKKDIAPILNETESLSIIDVLAMQPGAQVILKAGSRPGLPQKIVRVAQDCVCLLPSMQKSNPRIQLRAGDCVASYRIAGQSRISERRHTVRLTPKDLEQINALLVRRFNSSLEKESKTHELIHIQDLPYMTIHSAAGNGLDLKSETLYTSDGKSQSKMQSIIKIKEDVCFFVLDTTDATKKHIYRAKAGEIFVLAAGATNQKTRLYPISRDDLPAIKMQDKKERLLRKNAPRITRAQRLFTFIRRSNREKFRN